MPTPIEEIDAGEYEVVAEFYDQMSRDDTTKDLIFSRFRKGQTVGLGLAEARRLYSAGAVVLPGERELLAATIAKAQYEAALAALPDAIRSQVLADAAATSAPIEGAGTGVEKPKRVSPKDDWVAYAVSRGADAEEAEGSTKDELIALYGG